MLKEPILLGSVVTTFGIKGEIKVFSHTRPVEAIGKYTHWYISNQIYKVICCKKQGKILRARLQDIDSIAKAQAIIGQDICVDRSDFSVIQQDELYWHDLIGYRVLNKQKINLGVVTNIEETAAQDMFVVSSDSSSCDNATRYIPWVAGMTIVDIDKEQSTLILDWPQDF